MDDRNTYIIEQCVEGKSCTEYLSAFDRQNISDWEEQCVSVAVSIAKTLRYLHNADNPVVHRDIKPDNIIINQYGEAFLVDFDCCLRYTRVEPLKFISLGTKGYAAPEQYSGETVPDGRADIYGLGVTLLQMLTNFDPISCRSFGIDPEGGMAPLRYYDNRFDPFLENIIIKMTAFDREERYNCVEDVIQALQTYKNNEWYLKKRITHLSDKRLNKYRAEEAAYKEKESLMTELKPFNPNESATAAAVPVVSAYNEDIDPLCFETMILG